MSALLQPSEPGRRLLLDRWQSGRDAIVAHVAQEAGLAREVADAILGQVFEHVATQEAEPIRRGIRELLRAERGERRVIAPATIHVALTDALRPALEAETAPVAVEALAILARVLRTCTTFHTELSRIATQQASERRATELERALASLSAAQQTLLQQARIKAMGSLADGVAHDVNNSLNAVLLRTTLLGRQVDEKAKAHLDAIEGVVRHAAITVQRLQEFARRRESPSRAACDPAAVVREAIDLTRPHWANRAEVDGGLIDVRLEIQDTPAVRADAAELRAIVVDLLLNATEAITRNGVIAISIRPLDKAVQIEVSDNGPGIPPEHVTKIFEPFFTTRGPRFSGLGLAMAWGVLDRLGGEIRAANRSEGGATFVVTIPCAATEVERSRMTPMLTGARGVLLVDDDAESRETLEHILVLRGHVVEIAGDGRQALALYDPDRHEAVLCDVTMPNMNGMQLARGIRARNPEALIALLTGWSGELADEERGLVDAVFRKPIDVDAVARFLARCEAGEAARARG